MSKVLVAYFSPTGTTAKAAEGLAAAVGADLFEIVPETPYTRADLDWHDQSSRSSVEMSNEAARPVISSKVEDMDAYDTVFVGFPIWWYVEPRIIDTFLEAYDFSGKTIAPFATSGSSGIGDAPDRIRSLVPGARVDDGMMLNGTVGEAVLRNWALSLGIELQ